jgi:diaminopimelate epimerase
VVVALPGGELRITYDADGGSIKMSGPATFVFEGNMFEKGGEG